VDAVVEEVGQHSVDEALALERAAAKPKKRSRRRLASARLRSMSFSSCLSIWL